MIGLQWQESVGYGALGYRFSAGLLINDIELENRAGITVDDSGHGAGYELAAVVLVPLVDEWVLSPGVHFRALSRNLSVNGRERSVDLRNLVFGIGIAHPF